MIRRTVVVNPVEPAILSMRSPLGLELSLELTFLAQSGAAINPDTLKPQLALLPRSYGGFHGYDIATTGPGSGKAQVTVPGSALRDHSGYTIEVYSRRTADNPSDPPFPDGLLARGALVTEGLAYQGHSPLAPMAVPVITGPPGPTGPVGPGSTVPGPPGTRGSIWTTGAGVPIPTGNEVTGDMYLNETNSDVWRWSGTAWTRGSF